MNFFFIGTLHGLGSLSAFLFIAAIAAEKPMACIVALVLSILCHTGAASLTKEEVEESIYQKEAK